MLQGLLHAAGIKLAFIIAILPHHRGAGQIPPRAMWTERKVLLVVAAQHDEDGAGHVQRNEPQQRATGLIFPGRGRPLAVKEDVTAFPDKIVLIAKGGHGHATRSFQEPCVDALVIGLGPAGHVLQRLPIVTPLLRAVVQPCRRSGDVGGMTLDVSQRRLLPTGVHLGPEPAGPMVRDQHQAFIMPFQRVRQNHMSGRSQLLASLMGDPDPAQIGEVIAIALVGHVLERVFPQPLQKWILPDILMIHGMRHVVLRPPPSHAKAGGSHEIIQHCRHSLSALEKGGVHGAADVCAVGTGMMAFWTATAPPTGMVAGTDPAGQASGMTAPRVTTGVCSSSVMKRRTDLIFRSSSGHVASMASASGAATSRMVILGAVGGKSRRNSFSK